MSGTVLYDVQGPRARRRVLVYSLVALVLLGGLLWVAGRRLAENGQFDGELWRPFVEDERVAQRLLEGLQATLKAALYGLALALPLGVLLAFGRLSHQRWLRLPATAVVEFFRAMPLLLLILGFFLAYPILVGEALDPIYALVFGLTLYNGAVFAEIVRAGILSLPTGQTEAALAVGLRRGQVLRMVLLPQAVRVMLPALISQMVVLLKDSSLGFVIGYDDLLRIGSRVSQNLDNPIQTYLVVALVFIVINFSLGRLAQWVEGRERRRFGHAVTGGLEMEQGGAAPGR